MEKETSTQRRKVLIVEDDPEVVEYLTSLVPLLGSYEVEQAFDGIEALAKVDALELELVILDLGMPKVDGKQILGELQKRHRKTKVLIISSNQGEDKTWREKGVQEVVRKPFELSELSQRVKRLLPVAETPTKREYASLLVVDDEPEINKFLKEDLFVPLGLEVDTACDGEEAFKIFQRKGCNLVILDLKMPKMNGKDLIHLLEASTHPPQPRVIMIMTSALGDAVDELRRLGYPILAKPLDISQLEKSVLQACEKYNLALRK